jgi:hypothetical protein
MAIFRKVHTSFWGDPFTQDLTPEQKYFYLYLITNDKTKQCGIYEITKRQICYDTGYNIDTVCKLLEYFINKRKIRYNEDTNELAVRNWPKYNNSTSPKVQSCINQELKSVKDRVLIQYIYSMDTQSQEEQEQEQEQEENKNEIQNKNFDELKKYRIEECLTISLNDQRWVKANKATAEELYSFNSYLEKLGKYDFNPLDYKKYFATIKGKYPNLVKHELTVEELRLMAKEIS